MTPSSFSAAPQKSAPKADTIGYKMKRLVHYINSKFKTTMFEIVSRIQILNVTINYLYGAFNRISGIMKQAADSFQKHSAFLAGTVKDNHHYIENVHNNFGVIDKTFDESFQITDALHGIAKVTGDNLSAINNIAELTNILALNASIEAARAGAAGKGFAVVAQEIRKHAATTQDAIKTISQNIKELIQHINRLAERMNAMRDEVKAGKSLMQSMVELSTRESTALNEVSEDMASIITTFSEYERMAATLEKMLEQSNASKIDIERMLMMIRGTLEGLEKKPVP
ncbi:MAG: methyl-accepting chemotaxis protein [Treponema sp.]|jgi:methyl-accepting chemotaxis protein|nr:methyl-accepting chemotaxis protein [Treponema sp.]